MLPRAWWLASSDPIRPIVVLFRPWPFPGARGVCSGFGLSLSCRHSRGIPIIEAFWSSSSPVELSINPSMAPRRHGQGGTPEDVFRAPKCKKRLPGFISFQETSRPTIRPFTNAAAQCFYASLLRQLEGRRQYCDLMGYQPCFFTCSKNSNQLYVPAELLRIDHASKIQARVPSSEEVIQWPRSQTRLRLARATK